MIDSFTHERISVVLAGHVDHGKSTIVGRLLADSGALPDGKLVQVKAYCERNSKPFEYAFLVDALKNEQSQGVTIDAARVFFRLGNREYILIDAPGHVELIRNMVTGAARADGALMVVDAQEGIQENSRRHGALLAVLGIRQLVVLVNKMDLVSYGKNAFEAIRHEFTGFLGHWGLSAIRYIPVSGLHGENIVTRSAKMTWFDGGTVRECLSSFSIDAPSADKPFRMWVQDVYKFTNEGDTRRIVAGTIESGSLHARDQVIFHPSGKKAAVKTIESFNVLERGSVATGESTGFTLDEQVYVSRGELATRTEEKKPSITSRLRVSLFWLGREPMVLGKDYTLKIGTAKVLCRLETVRTVQDGSSLELKKSDFVGRHEIADCDIRMAKALAFDLAEEIPSTGRFVIVDQYEIRGGGIIREALEDRQTRVREKVLLRDYKWERSTLSADDRGAKFRQKPALVIITGGKDSGKKPLARALETELNESGHAAYFLGIGNVLYGVDADIKGIANNRGEHIRRLAEVAHILVDVGYILIVTAIDLSEEELEIITTSSEAGQVIVVWCGSADPKFPVDMVLKSAAVSSNSVDRLRVILKERGILN